jgi:MarR family transcriptional regulator, transcriptional regulator for hemolysin
MHDVQLDSRGQLMALLHTAGTVQAHAEVKLATVGLSLPKLAALTALSEAGESMPLSQLAERLSCVKSNITQLVDRLEADGFVTRSSDKNDRRARLAVLTPAGRDALKKGTRIYEDTERDLLAGLEPGEARQLAALMEKLERRLG